MRAVLIATLLVGAVGLSIGRAADEPAPQSKLKSPAARKAEADYKEALTAAEQEFAAKSRQAQVALAKELEKAKDAASKTGDLEEAIVLRDRIKQLADAAPAPEQKGRVSARDKLAREVADVAWTGSPNWGRIVLKADGSVQLEKLATKVWRWGPISEESVGITHDGHVELLVFDRDRRSFKAYYAGQAERVLWEGTRTKPK